MKRAIIFITCVLLASLHCFAEYDISGNNYERIIFQIKSNINTTTKTNNKPKSPVRIPNIYIDDNHTLYFESDMTGYGIQIISSEDGETVLYEDVIATDCQTYTLPEYLCGEYLIELTRGNIGFIGSVEL